LSVSFERIHGRRKQKKLPPRLQRTIQGKEKVLVGKGERIPVEKNFST
jgi:hypothetical protein